MGPSPSDVTDRSADAIASNRRQNQRPAANTTPLLGELLRAIGGAATATKVLCSSTKEMPQYASEILTTAESAR